MRRRSNSDLNKKNAGRWKRHKSAPTSRHERTWCSLTTPHEVRAQPEIVARALNPRGGDIVVARDRDIISIWTECEDGHGPEGVVVDEATALKIAAWLIAAVKDNHR